VFVAESAALLDASQTPPLSLATCAMVVAGITTAVGVFAFVPAWRSGRRTTVAILTAATARAGHRSRVGRAAETLRLPLPVALGIREAFSRPARTWLLVGTLALAIAAAVATLGAEASLDIGATPAAAPAIDGFETPRWDPIDDDASDAGRLRPIIYGLDAVLLFTASANLLAAVMLGVRERRRDVSLLKAVGLTPAEIRRGFLAGQATVAVAATAVGIPIGLVLFRLSIEAAGSADEFAYPTWWWIVLLVPGAIATVLAVTAPYARAAANMRVSEALRAE
jgi:putative ABC transport system permease protein